MGYRSDFKLIAKGTSKKIASLQAYLKQQGSQPDFLNNNVSGYSYSHATWCVELYEASHVTALTGEDDGHQVLIIELKSTKLYGDFDNTIVKLVAYARSDLGVDVGTAQLGEERDDYRVDDGDSVYVPILCEIGDPVW